MALPEPVDPFPEADELGPWCDAGCGRRVGFAQERVSIGTRLYHASCASRMEADEWTALVADAVRYTDNVNRRRNG